MERQSIHLRVRRRHPGWVLSLVELGSDPKPRSGSRIAYQATMISKVFIGPGLRQRHADMHWRIACRPVAGHPPRPPVLLTLEFQATVDRHMTLRVARPRGARVSV